MGSPPIPSAGAFHVPGKNDPCAMTREGLRYIHMAFLSICLATPVWPAVMTLT